MTIHRFFSSPGRRLLLIGLTALCLSLAMQRYVERRRAEANLVWTDPENKRTLEAGFLALGGFRGILADVLWVRAITQQESGRYYELKLICDMIQKLQPTFTNIHSYQAHNMSYNLAFKAESCEDKWYWIRSGIEVLEKGLERNKRNFALWDDLAFTYMDRLGDARLIDSYTGQDCTPQMLADVPRIDDLTEAQREKVFTHPELWKGIARPARRDENLRYAAYYFYKSLETKNSPAPLITERIYGDCLRGLGHYRSKSIPTEKRKWDDWGAEEWWLEVMKRNAERGLTRDGSIPHNLFTTMVWEMGICDSKIKQAQADGKLADVELLKQEQLDDYRRFQQYFPQDKREMAKLIAMYNDARSRRQ